MPQRAPASLRQMSAVCYAVREDEIRNEFELLDFSGSGKLARERIKSHLVEKYQKVNFQILDRVLATMTWDQDDQVEK